MCKYNYIHRPQGRGASKAEAANTSFPTDDDRSKSRADAKNSYKEELLRQVRMKNYLNVIL